MLQLSLLTLIPPDLRQKALDAAVNFVVDFGKGFLKDEITQKLKKLRSDGAFQEAFAKGLQQAADRFVREYGPEDEDLAAAIAADQTFFANPDVQAALLAILKKPGAYLAKQYDVVAQSFDSVLPQRRNRERVNKAVRFFLKCLAEEVCLLPELRPIYEFHFKRLTAEAFQEQVALQKAQLQANTAISTDIRDALLQLTAALAEQKALPGKDKDFRGLQDLGSLPLHNLPQPDYERFIGRDAELKQIRSLLAPQTRHFVITIDGIGGIGKSALALEIADTYRRQFPELPEADRFAALIWATAKQTLLTGEGILLRSQSLRTLEDIYTTIAVALQREDITRARSEEQAELVRHALTQQRTLLIIDNLETVDDERVLSFIREVPEPTKVIVTTRHRIDVAYAVRLAAMPEVDALQLISDAARRKNVTLADAESKLLYQRTGGVPLAIVWSVAQMGFGYGVNAVLSRLGQPTGDIAKYCFEAALEHIKNQPAYKVLLALSLFAADASREALGQITGLAEFDRDDGLVMLEKLSLLNKSGNRFELLPLTKTFVTAHLKEKPELENSLRQAFIRYFQECCQKFGGEQWRLYPNLDVDLKNIQLALEWAYQLKMWREVGNFVDNLVDFLDKQGLWDELLEYSEMAVEAGQEINDQLLIAKHKVFGLGWVKVFRFRKFNDGLKSIKEGKSLIKSLDNEFEYAVALRREADIYLELGGNYDKTEKILQESLGIFRKLGHQRGEIRTLRLLGSNERKNGNLDQALVYFKETLGKAQEIEDIELRAVTLQRLSDLLLITGKFEEAYINAKEAFEIFERLNHRHNIGGSSYQLAKVEYVLGKIEQAIEHAKKAYEICSKLRSQYYLKETIKLLDTINKSPNDPSAYLSKIGVQGYDREIKDTQALFEHLKDE